MKCVFQSMRKVHVVYEDGSWFHDTDLNNVCDIVEANIDPFGGSHYSADVIDEETGEILFTLSRDDDDEEEEYFPDDWMDEVGYNPYMGCYDYDC